jgi:hypothetical protein
MQNQAYLKHCTERHYSIKDLVIKIYLFSGVLVMTLAKFHIKIIQSSLLIKRFEGDFILSLLFNHTTKATDTVFQYPIY